MMIEPLSPSMRFTEAAASFLGSRTTLHQNKRIRYVAPRTLKGYAEDMGMLLQFFGELRLDQIHAGHLRSYQEARATGDGFTRRIGDRAVHTEAGAGVINDEMGLLKRMMKLADAWTPQLNANYMRLQEVDADIPKSLSPARAGLLPGVCCLKPGLVRHLVVLAGRSLHDFLVG